MKKIVVLIMLSIFSFGSIHAEIAWNLSSDGTLTIFATLHMLAEGMPDYSYPDYAPWYSHRDKIKKVVIKNGVASIGNYAFYGCSSLTSLTIPNSVKSIGDFAFDNCSSLTSLTIGMRKIGNSFSGFSSLKTITFIDGVESIGERAFYRCSALSSVTFPNSLTSIGFEAFYDCFCLTKIFNNSSLSLSPSNELSANGWISYYASVIYNNVNVIIDNDFRIYQDSQGNSFVCDYIGTDKIITLPKNVYGIADYTFSGCSGLTSITIPNSVTSIGKKAFSGCSGLTSITIPNSVTSIESGAFMNCSGLTSITIPNSVTSIGSSAFRNCSNLTSISIPNSVTSIGGYAFSGTKWYDNQPDGVVYVGKILYKYKGTMPSNTKINIKEGTTVIAGEAFRGCEGLYSISIPNSVTVIENDAFFRCTNLKKATIEVNKYLNIKSAIFCENDLKELIMIGETLPQYTADDFAYGLYKITLYVPSSLYKKYRSTSPWSRFTNIVGIPDEIYQPNRYGSICCYS